MEPGRQNGWRLVLIVVDILFRRYLVPLALLCAVIFRYNLFSLVYLLFFVISLILPSPKLKSRWKWFTLIFHIVLLVLSLLFVLAQTFFQITIATENNLDGCRSPATVLRQIGLVQFDIPVPDVLRLLLPDVVVLLITAVTLVIVIKLINIYKKEQRRREEEDGEREGGARVGGESVEELIPASPQEGELKDLSHDLSSIPFPATVQSYWQIPIIFNHTLELFSFVLLGLTGIAVPSVTSLTYYLAFLFLLVVWSLHLRATILVRVLRILLVLYSTLHLILLDLYQFQSAQYFIPLMPLNTTNSFFVRLFGLTALVTTDCNHPTELILPEGLYFTYYLSPALLVLLLWILATDLRMWLFTPSSLWKKYERYYLPILDHTPSPPTWICVKKGESTVQFSKARYGSTDREDRSPLSPREEGTTSPASSEDVEVKSKVTPHKLWKTVSEKVLEFLVGVKDIFFSISYIFAIIAMMVWSVVYPSWPSLVFLLWAIAIWLIPKATPRQSLFFTSPVLVLYSLALLLIQYIYSFNIGDYLERDYRLVVECHSGRQDSCKSLALFIKTICTIAFFTAFREFVHLVKTNYQELCGREPGLDVTDSSSDLENSMEANSMEVKRAENLARIRETLRQLVATYWVLVVVGAFLLVTLTGEPSLLKTIYLLFFFFFIITYQVVERWWFYINFPLWCLLIVYAALELILVYTYRFDEIKSQWTRLYNGSALPADNVSEVDFYASIGLEQSSSTLRSQVVTLVPPAIFIAVMALQLRYLRPTRSQGPQGPQGATQDTSYAALELSTLFPTALRKAIKKIKDEAKEMITGGEDSTNAEGEGGDEDKEGEPEEEEEEEEEKVEEEKGDTTTVTVEIHPGRESPASVPGGRKSPAVRRRANKQKQPSIKRQSIISSVSTTHHSKAYSCYKFFSYLLKKIRWLTIVLVNLLWRFLELHMHKIVCLTLFATTISQISVLYWILLVFLVFIVVPLPYMNTLTYPIVTLYLGIITVVKTIFQFPVILEEYFTFPLASNSPNCPSIEVDKGEVFHDEFSPVGNDANWLGLHKAGSDNYAHYIALPIVSTLFLSLWFSARRYQKHNYHSKEITVDTWEKRALFLNVPRHQAERSVWAAIKYFINHIFEIYGLEFCWCMMAITVAVRIDVYGVIYVLSLGILLVIPRKILFPAWLGYLIAHGLLLLVQYFFLLGRPPGICFTDTGSVYPWSNFSGDPLLSSHQTAFKKWLFLPADNVQILNKEFLYADFIVYLLVCFQVAYFYNNPLEKGASDHDCIRNFLNYHHFLDYIKLFVFQYSFWITLFLVFFTAVSRISLLGIVYLLLLFVFVYRGQEMLKDSMKWRHNSWAFLRWVSWGVLLLRVTFQIMDCVFSIRIDNCIVILLFNGACARSTYYASPTESCPEVSSVGLWVDAFNFVVITLQIMIFSSRYSDFIKDDLIKREANAARFRDFFDNKVEQTQIEAKNKREHELEQLKRRSNELEVTSDTVDHLLYAGVKVPEDVTLLHSREPKVTSGKKDIYFDIMKLISPEHRRIARQDEEEKSVFQIIIAMGLGIVDDVTEWLEETSALYRQVVEAVQPKSRSGSPSEEEDEKTELITAAASEGGMINYGSGEQGGATVVKDASPPEDAGGKKKKKKEKKKGKSGSKEPEKPIEPEKPAKPGPIVQFDEGEDILLKTLKPSEEEVKETAMYEKRLKEKTSKYTSRLKRLMMALYYVFLSHSEYIAYFLIIINIIINGSLLSLVYVVFLYGWGLLTIPWPSKRFWLILIFYTMFMLVVKYCFQFKRIPYWKENYDSNGGLFPPRLIGIQKHKNFFANVAWDMLLLIALLIHRGLLRQYGLWRSYVGIKQIKKIGSEVISDVKVFVKRLVDPNVSLGARDFYVPMLFFDILCFLTIAFGVSSFGVGIQGSGSTVTKYIQENQVPFVFLVMLFLQFLSMLVDRAIYLRHALWVKLIFQVFLLVVWHAYLFFILPSAKVTNQPFIYNAAAQSIYFFKSCYFIISSFQIIAGYPTRVLSNFLATQYSTVSWLAFNVYRLIPILPDLREVMDWVFTNTTLSLINWFKVQEIYAQLYLVKVQRDREKAFPRKLGEKQSWLIKFLMGASLLTALVLLIWGPLLVFSLIQTASLPNPPKEVHVKLNLAGFEPIVQLTAQTISIKELNKNEYNNMRNYFEEFTPNVTVVPFFDQDLSIDDFRRVELHGSSTSLWIISPPARDLLVQQLSDLKTNNQSAMLEFSWTITRSPSTGLASETVTGTHTRALTYQNDAMTINAFFNSINNTAGQPQPVLLDQLFPIVIQAPANGQSEGFRSLTDNLANNNSVKFVSCNVNLTQEGNMSWWAIRQSSPYLVGNAEREDDFIEMIVYSSRIAPPVFSSIAGVGIITLYVSVVLVIGRFLRGYLASLPSRLIIDEILYPDPLIKLCKDIFLVRENKEFHLEEILVGKLFSIFRSPQKIVMLTEEIKQKTD